MGFAENLVKYRRMAKMTQEVLADKCNVTRQAVAKWEKGESLPDVYLIARIGGIFGVTIDDLIRYPKDAIVENTRFYVREIRGNDKEDFCHLMREHILFGPFYKAIEKDQLDASASEKLDDIYWTECNEGTTYAIRSINDELFAGYISIGLIETNMPEMSMQFNRQIDFERDDFQLLRELFSKINQRYGVKAMRAYINSNAERRFFEYMGCKNVEDEIIFVLPI